MALDCKRQAFQLEDGCPSVDVDLEFPDFEACAAADTDRLRGVALIDLRKSPAFPTVLPATDPIPIEPVDVFFECAVKDRTTTNVSVSSNPTRDTGGSLDVGMSAEDCTIESLSLDLNFNTTGLLATIGSAGDADCNPYGIPAGMPAILIPTAGLTGTHVVSA